MLMLRMICQIVAKQRALGMQPRRSSGGKMLHRVIVLQILMVLHRVDTDLHPKSVARPGMRISTAVMRRHPHMSGHLTVAGMGMGSNRHLYLERPI